MSDKRNAYRYIGIGAAALLAVVLFYWLAGQQILEIVVSARTGEISRQTPISEEATPIRQATFQGADPSHNADGLVQVLEHPSEGRILHFAEEFQITDGPDLFVWLTPSPYDPQEYIDLGTLKSVDGAQSYRIPDDADLDEFDTAIVWCRAVSVLFGLAELEAIAGES